MNEAQFVVKSRQIKLVVSTKYRLLSKLDHEHCLIDIANSFVFILTEIELAKQHDVSFFFVLV